MTGTIVTNLLVLLTLTSAASIDKQPLKRSYACPPNFIRLSHRCYFFSKEKATWQDAFYQCNSLHSNLAIIKNSNQDKLIRKTLSKKSLDPLERWLGGRFDWQRKQWKWAASGKPLSYKGFDKSVNQDEENLQWSCMIVDPALQYRWNSRSCLETHHFICQKKIQTITSGKSRKKLLQQYNTNQLNEIPIPDISNDISSKPNELKNVQPHKSDPFHIEIYPLDAQPAYTQKPKKLRRKKKKNKNLSVPSFNQLTNEDRKEQSLRLRRNKVKEDDNMQNQAPMYYKTYKEDRPRKHPLHPNPIVEEYNFAKLT